MLSVTGEYREALPEFGLTDMLTMKFSATQRAYYFFIDNSGVFKHSDGSNPEHFTWYFDSN